MAPSASVRIGSRVSAVRLTIAAPATASPIADACDDAVAPPDQRVEPGHPADRPQGEQQDQLGQVVARRLAHADDEQDERDPAGDREEQVDTGLRDRRSATDERNRQDTGPEPVGEGQPDRQDRVIEVVGDLVRVDDRRAEELRRAREEDGQDDDPDRGHEPGEAGASEPVRDGPDPARPGCRHPPGGSVGRRDPLGRQPEDDHDDDRQPGRRQRPFGQLEPVDLVLGGGEHHEPPGGAEGGRRQRRGTDPGDRRPGHAPQHAGQERDDGERLDGLLDQEGGGKDEPGDQADPERAASDRGEPEQHVEQGQTDRRHVDAGRPGDVEEVRQPEHGDRRGRPVNGPDPPAEHGRHQDDRGGRERVEEVTPGERVDTGQLLRQDDQHRPQRAVLQECHPEHRLGAVAGQDVAADADVLRVVVGRAGERRHGQGDKEEGDRAGDDDGGDPTLGLRVELRHRLGEGHERVDQPAPRRRTCRSRAAWPRELSTVSITRSAAV